MTDLFYIGALVLVIAIAVVALYLERERNGRELVALAEKYAGQTAELTDLRDFKEGLWTQKDCKQHRFPREPDVRKKGDGRTHYLFHCVICSTPVWISKPERQ